MTAKYRILECLALLIIGLLAAYLRLWNLRDNPSWYADEAVHLEIASHLTEGRFQFMAVTDSTLFFARLPLFELVLAGSLSVFGEDMLTLRTLTGGLGVLSVGMLWFVARRISVASDSNLQQRLLPVVAALLLAIYPPAVLYARFGFSYNLLTPLVLLVLWGLIEYCRTSHRFWLGMAALAIGVGGISDLMIFTMTLPLAILILARRWRDGLWAIPLILLPFVIYAAVMLIIAPDAFWFDAQFTFGRLGGVGLRQQLYNVTHNYTLLVVQDFWMLGGIIGFFLLRPLRLAEMGLLLLFTPILVLGRFSALSHLSFYYLIPVLPLVALGMAGLLVYGAPLAWHYLLNAITEMFNAPFRQNDLQQREHTLMLPYKWGVGADRRIRPVLKTIAGIVSAVLVFFIMGSPLMIALELTLQNVKTRFPTEIDPYLINAADARAAADYLDAVAEPDDVIIVSPAIGWQLQDNTVDFPMGSAVEQGDNFIIWGEVAMPRSRFHHDPRYTAARFVVVDNLWFVWGVPDAIGVAAMLAEVEAHWLPVFEAGAIKVYENPLKSAP